MATVIVRLCDRHQAKGDEGVTGFPRVVGIDGRWASVDLCPECWDDLAAGLMQAMEKWGVRVDGPGPVRGKRARVRHTVPDGVDPNSLDYLAEQAAKGVRRGQAPSGDRPFKCFWCRLDYAQLHGMMSHAENQHGLPGHSAHLLGAACPVCGDVFSSGGGGLTQHAYTMHSPAQNVVQLFHMAAEEGDPHGIVAGVLALGEARPGGIVIAKGA